MKILPILALLNCALVAQVAAQRPMKLEGSEYLPPYSHLCDFSTSGEYLFWAVRDKLRVYRTSDGTLLREIDIPPTVVDANHAESSRVRDDDGVDRLSLTLGGKKLIVGEKLYWRDHDAHTAEVVFRPQFAMFDVNEILSGQEVHPVIIQSPPHDATQKHFRPHTFVCYETSFKTASTPFFKNSTNRFPVCTN